MTQQISIVSTLHSKHTVPNGFSFYTMILSSKKKEFCSRCNNNQIPGKYGTQHTKRHNLKENPSKNQPSNQHNIVFIRKTQKIIIAS
jgi:hypothetical protein